MIPHSIFLSLSGLFLLEWCPNLWWSHIARFPSFLWLNNIPLCVRVCVYSLACLFLLFYLCFWYHPKKLLSRLMWKGNTNRLTDTENKLALAKGELEVGGEERLPGNLGMAGDDTPVPSYLKNAYCGSGARWHLVSLEVFLLIDW